MQWLVQRSLASQFTTSTTEWVSHGGRLRRKMKHLILFALFFATLDRVHSNIPEFCQLAGDEGVGEKFMIFLYYDAKQDECNPFVYKGQGGNDNRFTNERECMRNCSSQIEKTYPQNATEMCFLPKQEGDCSGTHLRFYYNSVFGKCKKFLWSGCHGNGNRFFDPESCNSTCAGVLADREEEEEEDEPDTPIAIICGVLLGLIILTIIITIIVLTVQSKKKQKMAVKSEAEHTGVPLRGGPLEVA
ncbi:thrombin inhibitor hemalin [Stigmatopora nigra]